MQQNEMQLLLVLYSVLFSTGISSKIVFYHAMWCFFFIYQN